MNELYPHISEYVYVISVGEQIFGLVDRVK